MSIVDQIAHVQHEIIDACTKVGRPPENITIIGVTKYVDSHTAKALCVNGISHLGENRATVFLEKYNEIKAPVTWHFIGTLQTRKVRDVINKIDYLHSLDRLSLAEEINKRAKQKVKCFVQVNVSEEASKHGLGKNEVIHFIKQLSIYEKIEVIGLMTMAPDTDDEQVIRNCFSDLKQLQIEVQGLLLTHAPCTELSMGMTNDYKVAIEEGTTFVRLGRCLIEGGV